MKLKSKLITAASLTSVTAASLTIINKMLSMSATSKELFSASQYNYYDWRLGKIAYRKSGSGNPILLVHDLNAMGSSYEWYKLIAYLNKSHTVYTVDLLGCGYSEKPDMTYTNYLYVQMLNDFIKNIIGHRTDIVSSGSSSSIAIMACLNDPELFNQLFLINPDNIEKTNQTPDKLTKLYKFLIDTPIIGTLIYNIAYSKKNIRNDFLNSYFSNPYAVRNRDINYYHESSHIGGYYAKKIYASMVGNFTNINIAKALGRINNSIIVFYGGDFKESRNTIKEYKKINPSIEEVRISKTKLLPHLELPGKFYENLDIYLR